MRILTGVRVYHRRLGDYGECAFYHRAIQFRIDEIMRWWPCFHLVLRYSPMKTALKRMVGK
jgi:hypothetical protein